MMKAVRLVLALCALAATVAVAAGCGGVPGNAVAEVDGTPIEKDAFEHWMQVASKSSGTKGAKVPDAPDFETCVADKKKTAPKPAEGQPKTTDKQLKDQCKQEYEALRDQVIQLLTSFEWIEGEAEEMGIKVTDAEVKKSFAEQKKQSFPKDADYEKFLKDYGQTEQDIMQRVKLDLLSNKIREKIIKGKDKVSDAQIQDFYDKNKERFAQPERRDLRIVLTKSEAQGRTRPRRRSRAASRGRPSRRSTRSTRPPSRRAASCRRRPRARSRRRSTRPSSTRKKGEVTGPVKTQFGYYVFEVDKVQGRRSRRSSRRRRRSARRCSRRTSRRRWTSSSRTSRRSGRSARSAARASSTQQCTQRSEGEEPTPTPPAGRRSRRPGRAAGGEPRRRCSDAEQ